MGALLLTLALAQAEPSCWAEEDAKAFRTCFDALNGLELAAGAETRSLSWGPRFSTGIGVKGTRGSHSKEGTVWFNDHRLLELAVSDEGGPIYDFTLYRTYWRRHVDEGFLVLQTTPPIRLPFPFDVGLSGSAFEWERRPGQGKGWVIRTASVAMLFDPVRSSSAQFQLGIGPELSHTLRHDGVTLHHELSAFSSGTLEARFESEDGFWALFAHGNLGATFDPVTRAFTPRGRGWLEVNRVLFAVNDQPVRLYLRAEGEWRQAGPLAQSEWSASAGLKVQLFSGRN